MTSLACWVGVDARGPSSAYIATDSRISWPGAGDPANRSWDFGRKAFAAAATPDVFAYVGDVMFPALLLSQFVTLLDSSAVPSATYADRFAELEKFARITHRSMPQMYRRDFKIVHCGRDFDSMLSEFHVSVLSWKGTTRTWSRMRLPEPDRSSKLVLAEGSGQDVVKTELATWQAGPHADTSRAVFSAFVDALRSRRDRLSGGAAQLVGIYRIGNGRTFGVVLDGKRYLHGLPVFSRAVSGSLQWRNELFERCDGRTGRRLAGAQRHRRG